MTGVPFSHQTSILSFASGHINHSLFWKNLAPSAAVNKGTGGVLKDGPLKTAIEKAFGSLDNLKKQFNTTTAGIQGSGWGWLVSVEPVSCYFRLLMFCTGCQPRHQGS